MDSSENPRSFEKYPTPQGDGGKPKPQAGTNSISTGTKIVPVRKEIFLSLKMMNSQPQHIQKRGMQKIKNKFKP